MRWPRQGNRHSYDPRYIILRHRCMGRIPSARFCFRSEMRYARFAFFAALSAAAAFAQNDRGTITGTITDPALATVPNAAVVARNAETSAQYKAETTQTGNYTIPSLPAGIYDVSVEAPGFKKSTASGIQVKVADTLRVDMQLQVGSATESVTVEAEAPL